jgi:hypothetical protein
VVGLLSIPIVWSRLRGLDKLNKILGYIGSKDGYSASSRLSRCCWP